MLNIITSKVYTILTSLFPFNKMAPPPPPSAVPDYDISTDELCMALSYVGLSAAAPAKKKDENDGGGESRLEELARLKSEAEERTIQKEATQRTLVGLDIKPVDVDQDLMALWKKITTTITPPGLKWGESCHLAPVAYGIKKIQTAFSMGVNNSSEDVKEAIEALKDEVQSVEITSMNVL